MSASPRRKTAKAFTPMHVQTHVHTLCSWKDHDVIDTHLAAGGKCVIILIELLGKSKAMFFLRTETDLALWKRD
jgi:hypothetical protein